MLYCPHTENKTTCYQRVVTMRYCQLDDSHKNHLIFYHLTTIGKLENYDSSLDSSEGNIKWTHLQMSLHRWTSFKFCNVPSQLFRAFPKKHTEMNNVRVSLLEVWEGSVWALGLEPNPHRPPPLICGPLPLLARNHRTVKRAFSNLPKAHKDNLL